jgi:hypothetical protein
MREIKVWGGVHPNERQALRFAQWLMADPPQGVDVRLANREAARLRKRIVHKNFARALPGNPSSPYYEDRRAVEVLKESEGAYGVVDIHNMLEYGDIMTAVIDRKRGVSPIMLGSLGRLGIRHLVLSNDHGLQGHVDNAYGLEAPRRSLRGKSLLKIRQVIYDLANDPTPETRTVSDFSWYEFTGSLLSDTFPADMTPGNAATYFQQFEPLPPAYAAEHGFPADTHMFSWSPQLNELDCWAETCRPTEPPDTTTWPTD